MCNLSQNTDEKRDTNHVFQTFNVVISASFHIDNPQGWSGFNPKKLFDLSRSTQSAQGIKISHATQEIAYLAPLGRASTLRGIVYGKGSKRKKECILFSLKTFSHKTVSNHSVVNSLRGPCPPSAALQALAGGSAGS